MPSSRPLSRPPSPPLPRPPARSSDPAPPLLLRRGVGLAILLLALLPLWRFLPGRDTGLAGRATAEIVGTQVAFLWSAFALTLGMGLLGGLFLKGKAAARIGHALTRRLGGLSAGGLAAGAGAVSFLVTALAARIVFEGRPNMIDALAQLTHARFLAEGPWGTLGGPADLPVAFFHLQNTVLTEAGWFSQYPPGHVVLLALGLAAGAVWLVGPLLNAGTAALSVLLFVRLLPERPTLARGAGLLVGVSPMLVAHAATYMNHASAAFFGVLALYAAVRAGEAGASPGGLHDPGRAVEGGDLASGSAPGALARGWSVLGWFAPGWSVVGWAALAGAAVTAMAAIRPLSALVVMTVVALGVWLPGGGRAALRAARGWMPGYGARAGAAVVGGLPLLAAHLAYNRWAFGSATTFGYDVAWGAAHGLGFHLDPYGNVFGPVESLLYTGASLAALNLNLLEVPLPLVAGVGAYLLLRRTALPRGERILALWALLPVAANAFYWHHGYFMGPRMLTEFVPAWVALAGVAGVALLQAAPPELASRGPDGPSPRGFVAATLLAGLLAGAFLGPARVGSYAASERPPLPGELEGVGPGAVVFMHGSWEGRILSRLVGAGAPLHLAETVVRQNPACAVEMALLSWEDRPASAAHDDLRQTLDRAGLDLEPRPRAELPREALGPGSSARINREEPIPPECYREVWADRFGAYDPSGLFWAGALPAVAGGAPGEGSPGSWLVPLLARDLGPERNRELLARFPGAPAWVWAAFEPAGALELRPYDGGMALLWGDEAG